MRREKTTMANYAILRVAKLTSFGNIAASGHHNFRERVTKNADEKRTHLNQLDGAQNTADLAKAVSDLLPKKRRKDAVLCIEYMISGSPEHFGDDWRETENYGADYFKDAIEWLERRHGKENVVCKTVHLDESTPHLAAFVVPITSNGRLSAKDFTGGRSVLAKMQTSFASEVGIKHGLMRGVEKSNAVHQENGKIAPMTAERLKLRKRVKDLEEEIDRLVKSAGAGGAALAAAQKALEQGQGELAVLSNKFLALEKKSEHQLKTNVQFNAHINVLEAQTKADAKAKTAVQGELVKVQGALATANAMARAEATTKTTAQGELVKVQGELATAAATARAEATAKTAVQGDLVAVQGELAKAQGALATANATAQAELVKAQGALATANATARAEATAKTTAQRELVKVQGELATAAATARTEAKAKTAVQGDLVAVQGELVKAKSDYAGAKIIIGQANEYIKGLFDENKNMKKSLLDGNKLDAYTKDLQAELAISNEKLALALDEKAAALRALVESGEKSAALLTTVAGHEAAAEQLRKISVMNSKATSFANAVITGRIGNIMHLMTPAAEIFESEKEYLEFASQVAQEIQEAQKAQKAQEAFNDKWVGLREATKEEWQHLPLVDVSGQQAVYGISKGKFAIHTFEPGEVVPKLNLTEQQKNGVQR
jgi:hypothetical protein